MKNIISLFLDLYLQDPFFWTAIVFFSIVFFLILFSHMIVSAFAALNESEWQRWQNQNHTENEEYVWKEKNREKDGYDND